MKLPTLTPKDTEQLQRRVEPEARAKLKTVISSSMRVACAKATEALTPLQKHEARAQTCKALPPIPL